MVIYGCVCGKKEEWKIRLTSRLTVNIKLGAYTTVIDGVWTFSKGLLQLP